jgi:hypothetical protein
VLPACRLKERPIESLALAFALALGEPADAELWRGRLAGEPEAALADLALRLRANAQAPETQIVLPIDQLEELLVLARPEDAAAVWRILNAVSRLRSSFVIVLTLRSDFLDRFQAASDRTFDIVPFALDPLPSDRLPELIRNPGRVVGLTIDDAFVQAAVRDTGNGRALPLLAFALRAIHDAKGHKSRWTLDDYEALRDPVSKLNPIENAVREAAERVLARTSDPGEQARFVCKTFVPRLVRVNDEGLYVRQPARRDWFDAEDGRFVDI